MLTDIGPDLLEMANIYPDSSGLPVTVWVSPRGATHGMTRKSGRAQRPVHVWTWRCGSYGGQAVPRPMEASVGRSGCGYQVANGQYRCAVDYWNGKIGTSGLVARLVKV